MYGLDFHFLLHRQKHMGELTKTEIMEMLLKLLQTDRDVNFGSSGKCRDRLMDKEVS
jgi:hypothetical protein